MIKAQTKTEIGIKNIKNFFFDLSMLIFLIVRRYSIRSENFDRRPAENDRTLCMIPILIDIFLILLGN